MGGSSYKYDGLGRRTRETSGGLATYYQYSRAGQLLYAEDYKTARSNLYIYLSGSLVAKRTLAHATGALQYSYQHTDALGSLVAATNASGAVQRRERMTAYGEPVDGAWDNGHGFTGHQNDAATKLVYMQQRYYDPVIGRFMSVDPVSADLGTGELFARNQYAGNNPYTYIDPDGRKQEEKRKPNRCDRRSITCTSPASTTHVRSSDSHVGQARMTYAGGSHAPDGQMIAMSLIPRDTVEAKIRDEIRKGNWEDAIDLARHAAGDLPAATQRLLNVVTQLRQAGYTRNSISHVFKSKHELSGLVRTLGSEEATLLQIHNSAQSLATGAANGTVINGTIIKVSGQSVWVQGRVIDGVFRVSSASMRGVL